MPKNNTPPLQPGHDDQWVGSFELAKTANAEFQRKEDMVAIVATTTDTTLGGLQTIDGVTLTNGQRVLVWKQTTATQNALYRAATGRWVRESYFRIATPISIIVAKGTTYGKKAFVVTADDTVAQYGGAGGAAGAKAASNTNVTLSGNQTIDAISCVAGDPVLLFGQSNASQNGLYTVSANSWTTVDSFDSTTLYKIYGVASGTNFGLTFFIVTSANTLGKMGAYYL